MMLPTQDKDLKAQMLHLFDKEECYVVSRAEQKLLQMEMVDLVCRLVERCGYYKGFPASIEEALNSGDGVYRP